MRLRQKMFRFLVGAVVVGTVIGSGVLAPVAAAEPSAPAGSVMPISTLDSPRSQIYSSNWASPDTAYTYTNRAGWLGVVQPDLSHHRLLVKIVNPTTRTPIGTRTISIPSAWTDWGGFYAGPDGFFYILVGRGNPAELNARSVMRVLRYNASWKLVGGATVTAGQYSNGIYEPFEASAPKMLLVGDRLVVHMGTLIYGMKGIHHQTNFTFEVNTKTMGATAFSKLGNAPYASHSFQQFVAVNGNDVVLIDHGDAYPRAIQMGTISGYPKSRTAKTYDIYPIAGGVGDNYTGVQVTDLASGPSGVLLFGKSVDQRRYADRRQPRNVFMLFANPSTGASRLTWLSKLPTAPSTDGYSVGEPRVVQVGEDQYAVMFDLARGNTHRLEYRLFDSGGKQLGRATFPGVTFAPVTDPIQIGASIFWVGLPTGSAGDAASQGYAFGLDLTSPTAPKVLK